MTTTTTIPTTFGAALRRLYLTRFVVALVWAALVLTTATAAGPWLTTLLVVYPLVDAAAVLWQVRVTPGTARSTVAERVNVVVSVAVAVALGVASTQSLGAALAVWGVWAIGAGVPQLVAAVRNRRTGGQVAQMLSGGLSVVVGGAFLAQGLQGAETIAGTAGYAALGGIFFLVSALRLGRVLREKES
ncbi:hypothetical protein [Cellulosimicrobium composti]|uniref:Integral membrane protein n=1 Tax=Cellulosimicrobium composti TaxID=2672572 RepID=A0A6N7ZL44_9MICO|nr:hypothetical protein [Cellulosimicrobium composti]MTG89938.1 hypothetical protein [Cellulosimicrobium composti]